jgi:drug/metabolite transporter (DMT)-like permease
MIGARRPLHGKKGRMPMKYITVALTLLFVTYGQLIIKYEINRMGRIPTDGVGALAAFFLRALTNIGILSGLLAAVCAAFAWMAAMSRFQLGSIYPLLSLNFVIVPLLSVLLFKESLNAYNISGIAIIVLGIVVFSRGL